MYEPWIRRYFAKQDDWTLWCIAIIWWVVQFTVAFTIITKVAVALVT